MKLRLKPLLLLLTVVLVISLPALAVAKQKKCGKHKHFCPEAPIQTAYGPVQGAAMGSKGDIEHPPVYA